MDKKFDVHDLTVMTRVYFASHGADIHQGLAAYATLLVEALWAMEYPEHELDALFERLKMHLLRLNRESPPKNQ